MGILYKGLGERMAHQQEFQQFHIMEATGCFIYYLNINSVFSLIILDLGIQDQLQM